jgi:hypothetical protein
VSILGGALPRQCEVNGDSILLCRAHLILQPFAATRYYLLFRFESALVISARPIIWHGQDEKHPMSAHLS